MNAAAKKTTPALDDAAHPAQRLRSTLDETRDALAGVKRHAARRSRVGINELEARFSKLEAEAESALQRDAEDDFDGLQEEVSGVLSQLQEIDASTRAGGKPEAGRLAPEPRPES